jgi:RNA polymerase sigma-70 factor (ECF subfamily)
VVVSREDFAACVRERDPDEVEFWADLYLACACVHGDEAAIRAFEAAYFSEVGRAMARRPSAGLQRADVEQTLRQKLFVAPARLAQYTGRGPLRMWVRVTVTRLLHNLVERGPREAPLPDVLAEDIEAAEADPELQHMKETYREEFRAAFAEAVSRLDVGDRVLLHQTFALKLKQAALADAYDVHINTIARWLRRARGSLEREVRGALTERLEITQTQFDSVFDLVRSRLDLSLGPLGE